MGLRCVGNFEKTCIFKYVTYSYILYIIKSFIIIKIYYISYNNEFNSGIMFYYVCMQEFQ